MADTMINAVYKDANAPIEARVKDLLSRMTLQEKLGQMAQIDRAVATPRVLRDLSIACKISKSSTLGVELEVILSKERLNALAILTIESNLSQMSTIIK
ncbi:lysosomal beta glucosidase [Artemisia annua]|uniref:Lysosomal beta glucosidase n=1 Tax=Artemisia annua TaxID=35608 RepID=A0A2U1NDF0_ARTAN|nr:lysosomal beta glucosidase [Artemisia annua]